MSLRRGSLAGSLVLLGVALLFWAPEASAQCAMCRTLLTNSPEGRAMSGEFNKAILLMLFAPYLVFGSFTLLLLRERIRGRLERLRSDLRARRPSRLPLPSR